MKVTSKIKLDLRSQNYGSSVYAVQGDGGSRCVEAALLDGGKPWDVPAGVTAAVAYKKPDFTKGLYDKLADDTPAVTVSGSTVTVVLAKQMLTVPGSVQACIVFNNVALDQLTTFPFTVAVAANPVIGAEPSDDYIRLQWLEDKLDEYVKKITEGIVPGGSGGAVSSVNGKTGAVVLTADDVHALPDNTVIPTVPEKVSAFENDAGYLTEHQDISGKVDKVAGKGLSTHDYDDAAKAKVDAIPEDPKYTDTEYDDTAVVESLNQLKDDLADVNNTTETPAGAGKVWTATESGAGWFDPPTWGGASKSERLIQSYTTEVVGNQVISQDMDGNPFSLRSVNIHMYVPASESASGVFKLLSGAKYASFGYITQMANTSDRVVKFNAEVSMTGVFASWYLTGKPGYPSANTQVYAGIDRDMTILDGIDKIYIGCNVLPVGTTIIISGVDV